MHYNASKINWLLMKPLEIWQRQKYLHSKDLQVSSMYNDHQFETHLFEQVHLLVNCWSYHFMYHWVILLWPKWKVLIQTGHMIKTGHFKAVFNFVRVEMRKAKSHKMPFQVKDLNNQQWKKRKKNQHCPIIALNSR